MKRQIKIPIAVQKQTLLNFIEWKLENSGETEKERKKILDECKKKSYGDLHSWAVRNDYIDY